MHNETTAFYFFLLKTHSKYFFCRLFPCPSTCNDQGTQHKTLLKSKTPEHSKRWWRVPGGQLTLLEPLGDLARGQPSPIDPGGLAGELLLFIKSYGTNGDSSSLKPLEIAPNDKK